MKKLITYSVISAIAIYIAFSYVLKDPNLLNWEQPVRLVFALAQFSSPFIIKFRKN